MVGVLGALRHYLIVFTASACGLIIEIVAGRLLAPHIGVSLYTWTSIIGIVLAGISIGNYVGGRVAGRFPSPITLGVILMAAGIASISILPMVNVAAESFSEVSVIPRIVLLTAVLFLVPSLILGMVTPVVIKLSLTDLANTGNVVGKIYAVSTAGSIFGTFLTGFVLIQFLGTRAVILTVSLALVAMAVGFGGLWRARLPGLAMGVIFAGIGVGAILMGSLGTPCVRESNYFCIRVTAQELDGREVRVLYLDALLHSYVDLDDPLYLRYAYEKVFADLASVAARGNPDVRVLFIGGGGYTMPRFMEAMFPDSGLEVVEIDPQVTRVATEYLGLSRSTRIVTYNEDARTRLQRLEEGRYDLVIGDAFNDVSVPYHLTTLEFNDQLRGLLAPDGIYAVNIVDKMYSGRFLRSFLNTLQRTFPYVYVMRDDDRWDSDARYTFVGVGSLRPLSAAQVALANLQVGRGEPVTQIMEPSSLEEWLRSGDSVVLTDDFVPVDGMLAPLYLDSR